MTTAVWDEYQSAPRTLRLAPLIATSLFVIVTLSRIAIRYSHFGALYLEDDAYYYTVIAHHIAQSGLSTFDGQTLTNGYHPLWLGLLVLQDLVVGPSNAVTIGIELCLATAALWLFLGSFRSSSVLFQITFAAVYATLAWPMIVKGMEVSLFLFALAIFMRAAIRSSEGQGSAILLGLTACFCIGARIDAAVFVVPIMLLVAGRPRRILALLPVALAGAAYAIFNFKTFGVALPISGEVKSMGGLQLNHALLDQVKSFWNQTGALKGTVEFLNSFVGRPILIFGLALLCLLASARTWTVWAIGLGYLAGFLLFALKLAVFSSWVIWPWYSFPTLIGLFVIFLAIDRHLAKTTIKFDRRVEAVAVLAVLAASGWQARSYATRLEQSFEVINIKTVSTLAPIFNGERVAMGDRAGSFAEHYAGPLTQLEGLVNDKAYFEKLRRTEDIKPLLCARGVHYVLAYQPDLGRYETTTISVLRPSLTQYPSPKLTFAQSDEVGRVFDLSQYDNRSFDEGDNYLYAWRLSGCPETGSGQ